MAKFNVLTYCGQFVDEGQLEKGIYTTSVPLLRHEGTSIEGLVTQLGWMKDFNGETFLNQSYFDNLRQCTFVTMELGETVDPAAEQTIDSTIDSLTKIQIALGGLDGIDPDDFNELSEKIGNIKEALANMNLSNE